jgi:hypothetical protein
VAQTEETPSLGSSGPRSALQDGLTRRGSTNRRLTGRAYTNMKKLTSEQMLYTVRQQRAQHRWRSLSQGGDHRTNLLQVEAAGSRHGDRGVDAVAAVGRRRTRN